MESEANLKLAQFKAELEEAIAADFESEVSIKNVIPYIKDVVATDLRGQPTVIITGPKEGLEQLSSTTHGSLTYAGRLTLIPKIVPKTLKRSGTK